MPLLGCDEAVEDHFDRVDLRPGRGEELSKEDLFVPFLTFFALPI
jgi:hypothetical protein